MSGATERDRAEGYLDPRTGLLATKSARTLESPEALRDFEDDYVEYRLVGLELDPGDGEFDLAHLQAIHAHLFQDVYAWAGQLRTINMSKGWDDEASTPAWFASLESIPATVQDAHDELERLDFLRDRSAGDFADGLVRPFNLVNLAHPFREGNGRTQRAMWDHLTRQAGHRIEWDAFSGTAHGFAAMRARTTGDIRDLHAMLVAMVH
jgi:cell filamentation protein